MKICTIGIGYVGLSAALSFAKMGHFVYCIDKDKNKIENLKKGIIPIYEPNMQEVLEKNKERLIFSTDLRQALAESQICFVAVGTPSREDGSVDLKYIFEVVDEIIKYSTKYTLIVNKSTVPIGFNNEIKKYIKERTNIEFDIASNPEFLRQGSALDDFLHPQRIIIGSSSKKAIEILKEIYAPFNLKEEQLLITDENSAEMVKYASNSFLALKISFINEIAALCEKTGSDIESVKRGIALDKRIGEKFLNAGLGFGGSCFPKDTSAILKTAQENNIKLLTIKSAKEANERQINLFIEKILNHYKGNINHKIIAVLGISFKPNTDDTREAPSIKIIKKLLKYGAKVKAYDPKAKTDIIKVESSYKQALLNADCAIIATEWEEFKNIDTDEFLKLKDRVIFDGRNIYLNRNFEEQGLKYICIGKK